MRGTPLIPAERLERTMFSIITPRLVSTLPALGVIAALVTVGVGHHEQVGE